MAPTVYHEGKFPPAHSELALESLIPFLGPAYASLARFDGVLQGLPNENIFLSPLVRQEAVLSSRIEGTRATLGDVLEFEAGEEPETLESKNDIAEIINYRKALLHGRDRLDGDFPFCQRLLKECHCVLLDSVRGKDKAPGEYRRTQTLIGNIGDTVETAKFIPIKTELLAEGMGKWEKFANEPPVDRLIQLAIMHVEFEALHPFNDGNGRVGRMMIPLFLYAQGIISSPTFYVSAYFERYRDEYYERLRNVSKDNDWNGWCKFFLKSISEQALENYTTAMKIQSFYEEMGKQIADLTRSQYAGEFVSFIFSKPIFSTKDFVENISAASPTARALLKPLVENSILRLIRQGKGRRPSLYMFPRLLNLIEGRDVF